MRRRDIILVVGAALAARPLAARAQQHDKPATIGFLGADASVFRPWTAVFTERLRDLGWIEGRTITIEYRWSEGRSERVAEIAAEFVRQKVDVIVTYGGAVARLKQATSVIPIVFAVATDPIGSGLVASLSQPGGNVTGSSVQASDSAGKRLEFLRAAVPRLRRLAIMFNAAYSASTREMGEVQAAARAQGLEATPFGIRRAEDIVPVFDSLKAQAEALYLVEDALVSANSAQIITLALSARLPATSATRDDVPAGCLMSYGPSFPALFRRAAEYVDKILRGTKPGDIPVEQPTKFDLVINLKIAKALELTIPPQLLALADEVIE